MFESSPRHTPKIESTDETFPKFDFSQYTDSESDLPSTRRAALALFLAFGVSTTGVEAKDAPKSPFERQSHTAEFKKIESKTGVSFEYLSKFCRIELQVKAKEGAPYILHIGQIHKVNSTNYLPYTDPVRKEIASSQINVGNVLEHLIENGVTDVFAEGKTDELLSILEQNKAFVINWRNRLSKLELNDQGLNELSDLFEKVLPGFKNVGEATIHVNSPLHHTVYILRSKLRDYTSANISNVSKSRLAEISQQLDDVFPYLGQLDTPLHEGSEINLFFQNQLNIHPTSTTESMAATAKFTKWHNELIEKNEKGTLLRVEFEKFKLEYQKSVFDDREKVALAQISSWKTSQKPYIIPLIYGADHNFTKVVKAQNAAGNNISSSFGLISCKTNLTGNKK